MNSSWLLRACSISFSSWNVSNFFLYGSSGKEKESRCLVFSPSTKNEIRHFHHEVVQWRKRNVQKSMIAFLAGRSEGFQIRALRKINIHRHQKHINLYYSLKIFPRFWLVKTTCIIHHNQLLLTTFGKNYVILNWWRQMCSLVGGYLTVDRENPGTRLCSFGS